MYTIKIKKHGIIRSLNTEFRLLEKAMLLAKKASETRDIDVVSVFNKAGREVFSITTITPRFA
jgi:hypothetical protein